MRVLITGSAGFIGSALSLRLQERGDEVIGVDCLDPYYEVSLKKARLARTLDCHGYTDTRARIEDRAAMQETFAKHQPQLGQAYGPKTLKKSALGGRAVSAVMDSADSGDMDSIVRLTVSYGTHYPFCDEHYYWIKRAADLGDEYLKEVWGGGITFFRAPKAEPGSLEIKNEL